MKIKKYYKVFGISAKNRFKCYGTYANKKDAYRHGKELHNSYITKTVQGDCNNQGRIICTFDNGFKFEE